MYFIRGGRGIQCLLPIFYQEGNKVIIDLKEIKLEELTDKELKALEKAGVIKKTKDGEYIVDHKMRTKNNADYNSTRS